MTDLWATVPRELRSIVRAYINSEKAVDKERASELCREYGVDYDVARAAIMAEMVAYEEQRNAD